MAEDHYYFEVRDLVTRFGDKVIFDHLDLTIRKGESVVILGRSGEGKSVLLRHLLGLMNPNSGTIYINGEDVTDYDHHELNPIRKKMGILFQDGALFDFLSVAENVAFPLAEAGIDDDSELESRAYDALKMVGLEKHLKDQPANLSGGMRKRVALARATIANPDCLLCDEPTAGLDPVAAVDISRLIREMVDAYQATAITVTHDITAMDIIADRVVMLKDGKIRFSGSLAELHQSSDPMVQNFLSAG